MISPDVALAFVFDAAEEHFLGLVGVDAADVEELVTLFFEDVASARIPWRRLVCHGGSRRAAEVFEVLFLDRQRVEFAIEGVFALGESGF